MVEFWWHNKNKAYPYLDVCLFLLRDLHITFLYTLVIRPRLHVTNARYPDFGSLEHLSLSSDSSG